LYTSIIIYIKERSKTLPSFFYAIFSSKIFLESYNVYCRRPACGFLKAVSHMICFYNQSAL
jgi:hypothetical protein